VLAPCSIEVGDAATCLFIESELSYDADPTSDNLVVVAR